VKGAGDDANKEVNVDTLSSGLCRRFVFVSSLLLHPKHINVASD